MLACDNMNQHDPRKYRGYCSLHATMSYNKDVSCTDLHRPINALCGAEALKTPEVDFSLFI